MTKNKEFEWLKKQGITIKSINEMENLDRLDLSNKDLKIIPNFKYLKKLQFLNLSHNQIEECPNFSALKGLVELNLSHNKLLSLPTFKLPFLMFLRLENNFLMQFPNLQCKSLIYIYLEGNPILYVDLKANAKISLLTRIYITNCYHLSFDEYKIIVEDRLKWIHFFIQRINSYPTLLPTMEYRPSYKHRPIKDEKIIKNIHQLIKQHAKTPNLADKENKKLKSKIEKESNNLKARKGKKNILIKDKKGNPIAWQIKQK